MAILKMNKENTISIYGSHDASITFIDTNSKLRVYEYERFVKKRYAMFSTNFDEREGMSSNDLERRSFLSLVYKNLFNKNILNILYGELYGEDFAILKEFFPNANFEKVGHHLSHAASGYFSSKFNKSLIFSVDGGGLDGNSVATTKVYLGENGSISELVSPKIDLGNPYSSVAFLISEIKPGAEGDSTENSLVYAGKIMGLCAYGKVREEWIEPFRTFYNNRNLKNLCETISIPYGFNSVSGDTSYDLAATSQYVFEEKMNELILPLIEKYNTNVVLVGGCALNVLYNQKLYEYLAKKNLQIFVPSNPNDCGQSYGMFLNKFPEIGNEEISYMGIEVLDMNTFERYLDDYKHENLSYESLVNLLKKGKIIGIVDGFSEVGPRALGNRSIICDPSFPEMKDILNAKVKFREWYRPFAPVCRLEDKDLYFENATESKYMSYAPKVKQEFKDKLSSIVHADDTTRLQTTTPEQHKIFYEILTELKRQNHIPVILNTSFNVKGFPILTTLEDAFYVLDNTELDCLLINGKIFFKK